MPQVIPKRKKIVKTEKFLPSLLENFFALIKLLSAKLNNFFIFKPINELLIELKVCRYFINVQKCKVPRRLNIISDILSPRGKDKSSFISMYI